MKRIVIVGLLLAVVAGAALATATKETPPSPTPPARTAYTVNVLHTGVQQVVETRNWTVFSVGPYGEPISWFSTWYAKDVAPWIETIKVMDPYLGTSTSTKIRPATHTVEPSVQIVTYFPPPSIARSVTVAYITTETRSR